MSNPAISEENLVTIRLENVTLYLGQFLNFRIRRGSYSTILICICISLVIQRLRRHYSLTGLSDYVLFLCTVNITSQRRDQQSCQDLQDDQDYVTSVKPPFLLRRFCCSAIIFSIMILFLQISFLFFYLCKPRRCSAGLHFFFYAAGRFCAVTPVLTGMSYRRSMRSESEKTASVISASRKMVTVAVTVRPDSSSSKYRPARRPM